jgi:hypothetical protein
MGDREECQATPPLLSNRSALRRRSKLHGRCSWPESPCGKLDGPAPIPPMTRRPRQQYWRSSLGPDHDRTGHHEMAAALAPCPTANAY